MPRALALLVVVLVAGSSARAQSVEPVSPPAPVADPGSPGPRASGGPADPAPQAANPATDAPSARTIAPAAPPAPARDPLAGSPDVAFRVLEPKQFPDALRHELVLFPAVPQLNGTFTRTWGTTAAYVFHVNEWLGLRLQPFFNWRATPSRFETELLGRVRQDAAAASSVTLKYGGVAGPEWAPLSGKFSAFGTWLVRYQLVLFAGGGAASTRIELKAADAQGPATTGDVGARPLAAGAVGFRMQVGERFTIRLELQDLVHWGGVNRIDGCSAQDLDALAAQRAQGQPPSRTGVGGSCDVSAFQGTAGSWDRGNDIATARARVGEGGTDTLNVLGLYVGFGVSL